MIRTQIQVSESQHRQLRELARRSNRSLADLIRQSVDLYLTQESRKSGWSDLLGACGTLHDPAASDVAERHDTYLVESYGE